MYTDDQQLLHCYRCVAVCASIDDNGAISGIVAVDDRRMKMSTVESLVILTLGDRVTQFDSCWPLSTTKVSMLYQRRKTNSPTPPIVPEVAIPR